MARNPFLSEQTDYLVEVEKFAGSLDQDFGPFFGRDVVRLVAELRRLRVDNERLRKELDCGGVNCGTCRECVRAHFAVAQMVLREHGLLAVAPEGATDWDSRVDFAVAGEDVRETTPEEATDGCEVSSFSSRVCERGTKGCDTVHG